ncbi:MAG: SCO family protein [Hyphomicrobiaceae bacterium]
MKTIRLVAWAGVAVAGLALLALLALAPGRFGVSQPPFAATVGGPFRLVSQDGAVVTDKTLAGKPFAIFFGFTNCPDVCPTSMLELSETMKELGSDADRMRFLFVSVDHEHDTGRHLKEYLSNFDTRITGLTGTAAEIAAAARAYRVYYEKVKTKEGYTYNHTATIYMMDSKGRLAGTIAYQEDAKSRLAKLRRLADM